MKYRTIVADPPWPYEGGTSITLAQPSGRQRRMHNLPYPTLAVEQIKALPVGDLACVDVSGQRKDKSVPRDGSTLYLWTTTRFLRDAYEIAEAWGFAPTLVLVWCKPHRAFGMGGTFTSNVEFCLLARRGSPRPATGSAPTRWFTWPRGAHSTKPEAFYDLVEQISEGPYLELFARRQRLGWHVWGNEVTSDVRLDVTA